jgi:hypothetical protein
MLHSRHLHRIFSGGRSQYASGKFIRESFVAKFEGNSIRPLDDPESASGSMAAAGCHRRMVAMLKVWGPGWLVPGNW